MVLIMVLLNSTITSLEIKKNTGRRRRREKGHETLKIQISPFKVKGLIVKEITTLKTENIKCIQKI